MDTVPRVVDALIIGAGPAGSAAALSLRRNHPDVGVAVADKAVFPRDKSCGDALGPGVYRELCALGAESVVEGAPSPSSVRLRGPGDTHVQTPPVIGGKAFRGFVVPRYDFDHRLFERVRAAGVTDLTGWRLVGLAPGDGRVTATLRKGRATVDVSARLLVGADGAYSSVRRALFDRHPQRHTHVAIRGYVATPLDAGDWAFRLDFFPELLPAYGWLFPIGSGRANIGVGLPLTRARSGRNPREVMASYTARLRAEGLVTGEPERVEAHQLPHAGRLPPFTRGSVALVGDAAGMINPITGEGIFYGMASGAMLGAHVDVRSPDRSLSAYEQAYRRRFTAHYRASYVLHTLLRSRGMAQVILGGAQQSERLTEALATMIFDEGTLSPVAAWKAYLAALPDQKRRSSSDSTPRSAS